MPRSLIAIAVSCCLVLFSGQGFGQATVKKSPADQKGKAAAKAAPKDEKPAAKKTAPQAAAKVPAKPTMPAIPLTPAKRIGGQVLQYIPEDVVIVAGIQPGPMLNAKPFRDMITEAGGDDVVKDLTKEGVDRLGMDLSQIEEAVVFIDMKTIEEIKETQEEARDRAMLLNGLRQLGLAMHNFYDTYNSFPDDDGFGDNKGNLSWRVHLLPYLEQADLYNEFNLDEPWDSDHNKALIEKMPDLFKTDGVEDAGKTSIHVLTGEGTPFGDDAAPGFRMITDGTSNTILTVIGGPDTADVWTKPGGLEVDPNDPLKALGKVDSQFEVGFMDGSVRYLPRSIDPEQFLHLVQHQDGIPVNMSFESGPSATSVPGFVVRSAIPIDAKALFTLLRVDETVAKVDLGGHQATPLPNGAFMVFPDPQTMLVGTERCVKQMIAARQKSGEIRAEFETLYAASDAAIVMDIESLNEEMQDAFVSTPFGPILKTIVSANLALDATGGSDSLLSIDIETDGKKSAQQISGMVNGGYLMMKAQLLAAASSEEPRLPDEGIEKLSELMDSVTIEADEATVSLTMPRIEQPATMLKDLTPLMKAFFDGLRTELNRGKEAEVRLPIKSMGLAMHNYHDTYNGFPSWNSPQDPNAGKGLSWRVHLLPFLDEAALYTKFNLDEDWDSEHNKALIEQMPAVFKCPGVEKSGHTSYHVFRGKKTPFGADEPQGMRNIVDGTSNTLMIVQAGSDTADVWTKPSGLEYDPEDPKKCLGNIGERFIALLCDGSSRFLDGEIDDDTLLRLIEHADGQPVSLDFE